MAIPMAPAVSLDPTLQRFAARDEDGRPAETGNELLQFWNAIPDQARRLLELEFEVWHRGTLGARLAELVRLTIANHTGCPVCLGIRHPAARAAGVDEAMIASLADLSDERLTERERVAIAFADRFAADHTSIGEADYARLAEHLDERERAELTMLCSLFFGIGRFLETLTRDAACPLPA